MILSSPDALDTRYRSEQVSGVLDDLEPEL